MIKTWSKFVHLGPNCLAKADQFVHAVFKIPKSISMIMSIAFILNNPQLIVSVYNYV